LLAARKRVVPVASIKEHIPSRLLPAGRNMLLEAARGRCIGPPEFRRLPADAIQRAAAGDFRGPPSRCSPKSPKRGRNSGQAQHLLGQARPEAWPLRRRRSRSRSSAPPKFPAQGGSARRVNFARLPQRAWANTKPPSAALDRAARLRPDDAAIAHNRGRAPGKRWAASRRAERALRCRPSRSDHRLMPSLNARANLAGPGRGDWMGAPHRSRTWRLTQPARRCRAPTAARRNCLLRQGDWLRRAARP